jgi:hypothetical protein
LQNVLAKLIAVDIRFSLICYTVCASKKFHLIYPDHIDREYGQQNLCRSLTAERGRYAG